MKIGKSLQAKVGIGAVQKQDEEVAANWLLNFNHDLNKGARVTNIHCSTETKGGDMLEQ